MKSGNWNNYLTVPVAIGELEKIEMICRTDNIYRLSQAITANEKNILEAFDINDDYIKEEAMIIQNELRENK